jgi:predicted porin
MEDQISRLGIKGSEDLGNGLSAIYKMEFGLSVGDGYGSGLQWTGRNAYVGLAGGWGTFLVGRHDTPLKMSSGKLDFFQDTAADNDNGCDVATTCVANPNGAGRLFESKRVDGAIAYVSPSFSGLTLSGALVQTQTSADWDDADDFASAYSLAAQYSNGPWFASLAYEAIDPESLAGVDGDDDKTWRVGLGILGMAGFSASIIYEDRNDVAFTEGNDRQSWQIQGAYDFGNNRVKAMYGDRDDDSAADSDFDVWAIGYQYNFSSRTDVQVLYRDLNGDANVADDSVFAVQLDHSF